MITPAKHPLPHLLLELVFPALPRAAVEIIQAPFRRATAKTLAPLAVAVTSAEHTDTLRDCVPRMSDTAPIATPSSSFAMVVSSTEMTRIDGSASRGTANNREAARVISLLESTASIDVPCACKKDTVHNPALCPKLLSPLLPHVFQHALSLFNLSSSHPNLIGYLESGFPIGLPNMPPVPPPSFIPPNHAKQDDHLAIIMEYFVEEAALGRMIGPFDDQWSAETFAKGPIYCSPINIVPKDVVKWRIVRNLSFGDRERTSPNDLIDNDLFPCYWTSREQFAIMVSLFTLCFPKLSYPWGLSLFRASEGC